jgi:predicted flap endonuclease-1-like 5' DNA nuclease
MAGVGEAVAHAARDNAQAVEEVEEERASIEADMAQPEPAAAPDSEPVMPAPTAPLATETPAGPGEGDDLRKIKGVGPKLVTTLHALGVTRYEQIAGWTDADLDALDAQLGAFAGRPRRDSWVEQARLLSSGDKSGYESKFGKL